MVLTVTEDTPADMLAGSMELLVQLPEDHDLHTQRITVLRSTPMMDLLVQIATVHKLMASSYILQAIGERGLVLPHHPNTPIGTLDALQIKLLPKQSTRIPRRTRQVNQPFETTFRLQVHLPRNQLYVSRVSSKINLGEILDEVCREKNLDRSKYELRHPTNLEERLDLSLSLQDYHLQEVTLYAKQTRSLDSMQDIIELQRQEERHRQQTKQNVFSFIFKKSKESFMSMDSLDRRSVSSPPKSDEIVKSASLFQPPGRPQRKRRPAPRPPIDAMSIVRDAFEDDNKDKIVINHSRNSSDSSGYHEASVLSDNPDSTAKLPETLPRRGKTSGIFARKLAQTSQSSKSLGNLTATNGALSQESSSSFFSSGFRKKRTAPPPPVLRPLSSVISAQALERIIDSEESTSNIEPSKLSSDVDVPLKIDMNCPKKNNFDISVNMQSTSQLNHRSMLETATRESDDNFEQNCAAKNIKAHTKLNLISYALANTDVEIPVDAVQRIEQTRAAAKEVGESAPLPMPRKINSNKVTASEPPKIPKRVAVPPLALPRTSSIERNSTNNLSCKNSNSDHISEAYCSSLIESTSSLDEDGLICFEQEETHPKNILKNNCAFSNENQIKQQEKVVKGLSNIIIEDEKSNQYPNHKIENNFILRNSSFTEANCVNSEEVHFKYNNNLSNENEFIRDRISDIVNDIKDHRSLNLSQCLNNLNDTKIYSDSTEINVSSTESLLLECNIIPKERDNAILQKDHKIRTENIDSHDESENQRNNSSSNDHFLNANITKPERVIKSKSEQIHSQYVCQRPPRKTISPHKIKENIEIGKYQKDMTSSVTVSNDLEKNKEICTVISTIPKCEYLDSITEDDALNNTEKYNIAKNIDELCNKSSQNEELNNSVTTTKRTKIIRSHSKSDDIRINSLKKQKRYLTLPPEDIVHALNLNLPIQNSLSSNATKKEQEKITAELSYINHVRDMDMDKRRSYDGLITAVADQDASSEIEILRQKVSDTVSNVLPASSSPVSKASLPLESNLIHESCIDFPTDISNLNTSSVTVAGLQQDTSDYVSTMDEELLISDWEYQLPAPPSAFRDAHSPVFGDYDAVTLNSVEAFEEPLTTLEQTDTTNSNDNNIESTNNLSNNNTEMMFNQKTSSQKMNFVSEVEIDIKPLRSKPVVKQTSVVINKMEANLDVQKDIISELENKIVTGTLTQFINRDSDRKNMKTLSEPKVAPANNTLPNFTITTYSQQKKLDIFEEFEESSDYVKKSEEKCIKTFAPLSRNNTDVDNYNKENTTKSTYLTKNTLYDKKAASKSEKLNANNAYKTKVRDESELCYKWQPRITANQKINIQRSKSHILRSSNTKYQTKTQRFSEKNHESHIRKEIVDMKKAASITDLNVDVLKDNEKSSEWKRNILKYQEECAKEKQLQSLQVLKNILPQLKNAQQTEENASTEYNSTLLIEKAKYEVESNEHSIQENVVPTHKSRNLRPECKQLSKEKNTKSYVYTGPPAISLSSWSERSSVDIQIKTDTDYKLERNYMNSNKTVININGTENKKNVANYTSNTNKNNTKYDIEINSSANKNPELASQLIMHTTATDFKIPILGQFNAYNSTENENKSVVMGVEQIFVETPKETLMNKIDTTSVDFRELTKTFGQHVNFQQKLKRTNISTNDASRNLYSQSKTSSRCTTNNTMINLPMPVVKGFKIPTIDLKMNNNQIYEQSTVNSSSKDMQLSSPPTTPVITGVTLKNTSTKSKSMPVQLNPRDMLLESIRNFGGREKLKNITERW